MGINVHALNFLRYASCFGAFGSTLTIGRQSITSDQYNLSQVMTDKSGFCEEVVRGLFGATRVDSMDNSDYEGASIIFDLNVPIEQEISVKYNTIIDSGCLEHIFNVPQALKNISQLCAAGGQIIHILPANNFCGHGFYQFSPELFFSLYSSGNGYRNTEVFMASKFDNKRWFRVKPPVEGRRCEVYTSRELYVMVRTILVGETFSHVIQQSDYAYHWQKSNNSVDRQNLGHADDDGAGVDRLKAWAKSNTSIIKVYRIFQSAYRRLILRLSRLNPMLHVIRVSALICNTDNPHMLD